MPAAHPKATLFPYTTLFRSRGWQPFAFQREVWAAMAAGRSGLLHATTGSGKTDRKSTRLNSSHRCISYAVFCLKKKNSNKDKCTKSKLQGRPSKGERFPSKG